jgi:hypothetical protein
MDFQRVIIIASLTVSLQVLGIPAQVQGIEGTARRPSGNHMPSPKVHPALPAGTKTIICVFSLTNASEAKKADDAGRFSAVHTRLIRQIDTDDSGRFRIELPPGTYSVFTRKGNVFYATRRDEKNNIAPVEVIPGKMTRVECSVESDHAVTY